MNISLLKRHINYPLTSKIRILWKILLITAVAAIIATCFFITENVYKKGSFEKYLSNPVWYVKSAADGDYSQTLKLPYSNKDSLDSFIISADLPELNTDSILILKCRYSVITAKVDNKIIYVSDSTRIGNIVTTSGRNYCFIPLGKDFSNKRIELTIHLQQIKPYKSSLSFIELNSKTNFFIHTLRENVILILLSIIMLLCSFGSFTFFLLSYFSNKHRVTLNSKSLFWLSISSILATLWTITDSHILGIFTEKIILDGIITYFCLTVIPISFVHLFISLYDNNIATKILKFITELNFLLQVILFLSGIKDFPEMLIYTHIICFLEIIYCFIYTIKGHRLKNNTEKLVMYIGNCGFAICIAIVIIMFRMNRDGDYIKYFMASLIIYCTMQIAICGIRITKTTKKQAALHEAEKFALTDQLTKLQNRRAYSIYKKNISGSKLPGNLNIIYFDLNELKYTNDTLGHAAGDEMIVGFTDILKKVFFDAQLCCRMGGDEFMVIYRTEKEIIKKNLFILDDQIKNWQGKLVKRLSVSYGYASAYDYPSANFDELTAKADGFMYEMKKKYYKKKEKNNNASQRDKR